ncbi:TIM-barrel domain-containing protein [Streptomyces radiopugnans]|uniref:TIM-barrel domain-containing protein n=1 Tax=Streptomyces radiopugnans TaxID=403935 RepID=UPI003F1BF50C
MAFQEPLTRFITHVADPVQLPVRGRGHRGPIRVLKAEVVTCRKDALTLWAHTSAGDRLFLEVAAAGDGAVRVRLAPSADTETRSAAATRLVRPEALPEASIELREGGAVLRAGAVIAEMEFEPWRLRFLDADGRLLLEQNLNETDISHRLRTLPFGRSDDDDGRPVAYHDTFTAQPDEHFFGLGEKFTGFDKRGQRIVSWNYDAFSSESERSYKNIPMYLSSRGYGVLVDSGMATEFDLCLSTHSCVQVIAPDALLDYYVIAGPEFSDVLDRYHRLTGRPAVPPKWALGTWMSTGFLPLDQAETLSVARKIRERSIPCDVLHIDAYWQKRGLWSHMQWDEDLFPEPEKMFQELRSLGFRTSLWTNPYISVETQVFVEGAAQGHFLRKPDGSTYVADVWHGAQAPCGIVDFTNPSAAAWFQDLLRPLLRQGASLFKTDFGEGVPVDAVAANGMSGEALHNVYALLFNDAVADVTEEVAGHRVVWARSSFTGGQRHCGQWAGDNNATFTAMASTLRGGLSYALSGVPFWSHDVGGFTGMPSPDLFVRSAQFGAFSPLMRFHGTSSRFPWDFEPHVEEAVVDAVRLRYRLMPYLYSASVEAGRSGAPVMRPLVLHARDEPGTWSADLEYLMGPDLLVAPVTGPEGERHVYLPAGRWIDWHSGETHEGGRHVRITKALEEVPLLVRAGSLIAMTEPDSCVGDRPFQDLTITCWDVTNTSAVVHDEGTETTVHLARGVDRAHVSVHGPLAVARVAFRKTAGAEPPAELLVHDVPCQISEETDQWRVFDVGFGETSA